VTVVVEQSAEFEASTTQGVSGLVPGIEYAIIDNVGNVVAGPSGVGVAENEVGGTPTGNYSVTVPAAPATVGQYQIGWSEDGSWDAETTAYEDLIVVVAGTSAGSIPPVVVSPADSGPTSDVCSAWTTSEDAASWCSEDIGSDFEELDQFVIAASNVLMRLSGNTIKGVCERVDRPCDANRGCGFQVLARGHIIAPDFPWTFNNYFWWSGDGIGCGCRHTPRVKLGAYPVREIIEVLIDGVAIDPSEYRLDGWQFLTRLRDDDGNVRLWPRCQIIDLDDDQDGTFSVRYTFGEVPPQDAVLAANELACEMFKTLPSVPGECRLPSGVSSITRQGVTVNFGSFRTWAFTPASAARGQHGAGWHTGLPLVDAFLNSFNPNGLRRRPMIWSPDESYPETVGTVMGS
jgi:hypothetical protein